MLDEVDRVLQGRLPTVEDLPTLPYIERAVTEAMRLYPPAWLIGRRAIAEYAFGPYVAPPRAILIMSPFIVQRDARFYRDPERFDPDRWTAAFKASLPPFAYFPFGGGPRRCIGESFAWMELILIVATIAQRWDLRLVPGHPVAAQPLITLRAKHGMRMTLTAQGVEFITLAKKAGINTDDKVRARAMDGLRRTLRSDFNGFYASYRWNQQAVAVRALANANDIDEHYLIELFQNRKNMDATAMADLSLAMAQKPAYARP